MVFCTSTSQYWLRAMGRANIRIQLSALRATADTGRYAHREAECCGRDVPVKALAWECERERAYGAYRLGQGCGALCHRGGGNT
jgi:hypothetical protein